MTGRESLLPARVEGFTDRDEPRFSCIVWPSAAERGGWAWMVYSGDGSFPGSVQRGGSAATMATALDAAAEYARKWNPETDRV